MTSKACNPSIFLTLGSLPCLEKQSCSYLMLPSVSGAASPKTVQLGPLSPSVTASWRVQWTLLPWLITRGKARWFRRNFTANKLFPPHNSCSLSKVNTAIVFNWEKLTELDPSDLHVFGTYVISRENVYLKNNFITTDRPWLPLKTKGWSLF